MSAYGAISSRKHIEGPLASTFWFCKPRTGVANAPAGLTIHHLTLATAQKINGLVEYLHNCFAAELEKGMTYPQEILQGEPYTQAMFEGYFFAGDVLVAIVGEDEIATPGQKVDGAEVQVGLEEARNGRSWEACVAGCYYVSIIRSLRTTRLLTSCHHSSGEAQLSWSFISRRALLSLPL